MDKVPGELRDKLGIAIAKRTYKAYRGLLDSDRWLRLANAGARPQRLLWASTGTKDPAASDVLYIAALAAPFTVNTIPDKTLLAFADHGSARELMEADGGDAEEMIAKFTKAGIDCDKLATDLQHEAAGSFVKDWTRCLPRLHRRLPDTKLPVIESPPCLGVRKDIAVSFLDAAYRSNRKRDSRPGPSPRHRSARRLLRSSFLRSFGEPNLYA